ncbi:hypothetical protein TRICI_000433 [Trichomonascus ciferrii]|uniref:Endonuclease/exonuclease/phosphatase domain-containing protein n=1 Tax=Trichomonascus ciferrii TaxID=44093 RepID=A0A642VDE7_9ASCO|nr:hypothetical protein TRICI_000433 [Trichomonascus ciferrii]
MDHKRTQGSEVRVLSFNCWGLKHVSKFRENRLKGIGDQLHARGDDYDIVALQEVWVEADFEYIRDRIHGHLPYAKYYYSGIISGPGLAIFSRWPILSAEVHRFALNGRPSAFFRGDWFVGKSVVSAIINHPVQKIEVLNAHLHAPYGKGDAAYTCHRTEQAWEMARMARRAIDCGHFVLAMGDLNSVPDSLTYRLFQTVGGLSDSWLDRHGTCTQQMEDLSLDDQLALAGVTCDSQLNTWRENRRLNEAKRLDYIFYDNRRANVINSEVTFTEKLTAVGSMSDHFALSSTFSLVPETVTDKPRYDSSEEYVRLCDDILTLILEYKPTSHYQSLYRNIHFWLSVLLLVGILISVFWGAADNRPYVAFVFIFFTILITATGLTDGYIGFLFGRNEKRALKEFETEVILTRSFYENNLY